MQSKVGPAQQLGAGGDGPGHAQTLPLHSLPPQPVKRSSEVKPSPTPPPRILRGRKHVLYNPFLSKSALFKSALCVNHKKLGRNAYHSELFFRLKSTSKKHSLSKAPSPPGASGPARRGAEVSWKACEGPLCPAVCWAPAKRPTLSSQASEGPTPSSRSRGRRPRAPGWSEPPAVTELAAGSLTAPPLLGPDAVAAGDRGWRSIPTNEEVFQRGDSAPLRTPGGVQGHAAGT